MSGRLAGLLAAQILYLAFGAGLLPLLRIAPTRDVFVRRLGLAYLVGLAATGVLAATLALVDVPLDLLELSFIALVAVALGAWQLRRLPGAAPQTPLSTGRALTWLSGVLAGAASAVLLVLLAYAARAYAVKPLAEWDGWAIWGLKARALYEFGGTSGPVFTSYQPVAHPILLPALEAVDSRAMGAYDGTLIHIQLIALAFGFAAGMWCLLGDRVPAGLCALGLLALLSASPVLVQLSSNLADVPLAFFCALGVVSLARFLTGGESGTLVTAALFLGTAMLTKSEGLLFGGTAFIAAAAVLVVSRDWRRLRPLLVAAIAAFSILVPWRIFLVVHHLRNVEYTLSDVFHPTLLTGKSERVSPALLRLWEEISSGRWGMVVSLALIAVVTAALAALYRLVAFAMLWALLSFLGLVLIYWVSVVPLDLTLGWTAWRVIDPLVIGSASLALLLAGEAWGSVRHGARAGTQLVHEGGAGREDPGDRACKSSGTAPTWTAS